MTSGSGHLSPTALQLSCSFTGWIEGPDNVRRRIRTSAISRPPSHLPVDTYRNAAKHTVSIKQRYTPSDQGIKESQAPRKSKRMGRILAVKAVPISCLVTSRHASPPVRRFRHPHGYMTGRRNIPCVCPALFLFFFFHSFVVLPCRQAFITTLLFTADLVPRTVLDARAHSESREHFYGNMWTAERYVHFHEYIRP